ncbi:hypothetical protein GCM10010191_05880 [Actinomadura vinacea]|uniref:Uncharacterized protein n=1 Tax=Actinomadura vinacea TaxID=115336 RepID=A0ABP5VF23_9ACTN
MIPPHPPRRLRSQAVRIGLVSALSLAVAACSSDTTPSATGSQTVSPGTASPASTPDPDEDDEVTAYCVRGPDGTVPDEEPESGYRVVDEDLCDDDDLGDDTAVGSHASYFWYYGGRYRAGRVSRGSLKAPSSGTISTRSGQTVRAGLGGGGSRSGG